MFIVESLYGIASFILAVYGLNSLYLIWLYLKSRQPRPSPPTLAFWPRVTLQLPVFNEMHTVGRLLAAINALEYPRHLLEVQVLDDSTDETSAIVAAQVARLSAHGLKIAHLRRLNRHNYKAGALAAGLQSARGDFIAVFDADFVPPPDYLKRALPWFADTRVGCVQARWTHTNREYSWFTRLQALAIDGHFIVEQTARSRHQLFLNFNGTAGIWRRACIEDSGGWQADTLTEDLDLSYRAQLKGWRIEYLPELCVPAELPVQVAAFKRQQARWARGSLQTARKHALPLLRARLPLRIKIEALLHLTHYFVHPLILLALILALPMSLARSPLLAWAPVLIIAALGPPLLYLVASAPDVPGVWQRLALIPGLVFLGIGLSVNNSRAALLGLLSNSTGSFQRTPKFALHNVEDRWQLSRYALRHDSWVWVELVLGIYALVCVLFFSVQRNWGFVPWLLLYAGSFSYVVSLALAQTAQHVHLIKNRSVGVTPAGTIDATW